MNLVEHLPALQVVVPMLAAPLCVVLRRRRLAWGMAMLAAVGAFAIAAVQLQRVIVLGPIGYEMGSWPAPIGITYRVDLLAAFVAFFVAGIGAVAMAYAPTSFNKEVPRDRHHLMYAALLLTLTGLLGITLTADAFNVFVFLEISSLASYVLIGMGGSRRALVAAFRYLVLGSIGGTFILIGIGMMYMQTGTLAMDDLAARLPDLWKTRTVLVSFAFFTVGASLKLALWPLHVWLPNAYTHAPSVVSALIAATGTKVMIYVLMRFTFGVYGADFAFETLGLGLPLKVLAITGIYVASTVAIFQPNFKKLLAYSSVGQIGYMVLGLSLATVGGVGAAVLHMFNHALIKGGMFLAVGAIVYRTGSARIEDLRGAGKAMPWSSMAVVVGGLGLIGVPLTAGFVSKWALITALLEADRWPLAGLALLSSLIAVIYVWRFVEAAWFHEPSPALRDVGEAPLSLLLPTWVLIGASVVVGVWGAWSTDVAMYAAAELLGGAR